MQRKESRKTAQLVSYAPSAGVVPLQLAAPEQKKNTEKKSKVLLLEF